MTGPARDGIRFLRRAIMPVDVYQDALELHENERFAESAALLGPFLADPVPATAVDAGAPMGAAVTLQAWNLFHGGGGAALNELLARLDDRAFLEYPELHAIALRDMIQRGDAKTALAEAQAYIDTHLDPIHPSLAHFLYAAGMGLGRLGQVDEAMRCLDRAHALFELTGNRFWAALACNTLGALSLQQADYPTARHWLSRALAAFSDRRLNRRLSLVLLNAGIVDYKTGELAQAREHLAESLALASSCDTTRRQCFANIALGNVHRLQRDFESARRHLHTAYAQAQGLEYPREEALALEFLGDVYRDEGQTEAARRFYARARAIAAKIAPEGDIEMEVCRRNGECLGLEGRGAEALAELRRALELSRAQKDRFEEGVTLRVMSEVAHRSDDTARARTLADKASSLLEEIGARYEAAVALLHGAEVRLAEAESTRGGAQRTELLDAAWRQSTRALDLFLDIGVSWWTDRCRALVGRVTMLRDAAPSAAGDVRDAPGDVIVHAGASMRDLLRQCDLCAAGDDPVLITGETGTGKELLARRLHRHSRRANRPMVVVNASAIPATMFEREFFGHAKGAFSGADRNSLGYAALADGGTLFLDEIGELPLEAQPKLLRLLQDGTYLALGDPQARQADLRLVAATNADLRQLVAAGRFRADLFYRLQALELEIPPLRERPEDVLPLLRHFLGLAAGRVVELTRCFDERSLSALQRHSWPGNARELSIVARRAELLLRSQGRVAVSLVGQGAGARLVVGADHGHGSSDPADSVESPSDASGRSRLLLAMQENGGNRALAARALGISRSTLYRRLERLGLANGDD